MQRREFHKMIPLAALVLAVAVFTTACGRAVLRFTDSGRTMSRTEVIELARSVGLGPAYGAASSEAVKLRTTALTELRSHGKAAQALADALTAAFPADYQGVPAYVEAASVDGRDCWIVVEATPSTAGPSKLTARRYWLFGRATYDVIESGTLD